MNASEQTPRDLITDLNQKALLQLAAGEITDTDRARGYTRPTDEELRELFPELEVIEPIGSGGMGCVFRARQRKLEREIALKILPRELSEDARFAERFSREARAMARLNHPHIVSIHDFGVRSPQTDDGDMDRQEPSSAGLHFLVMEYMDGMNLRELLDAGPVPPVDAIHIFEQVCQALAFAHAEGVIHRDIKPENILFSRTGHVALADFGLARLATDSHAAVSLTQTRQAMGTLNYMAPEQWENPKTVDHRADVYSLGILLYEMLTGRIPRGSFPAVSTLCDVESHVDDAINRALLPDADMRHQNVAEFCAAVLSQQSGTVVDRPMGFDENGTLTNFMNIGANALRMIPRPRPAPVPTPKPSGDDSFGQHAIWISLICGLAVMILAMTPWISTGSRTFIGMEAFVLIGDRVQIPVGFLPAASAAMFVLALLRRKLNPIRSDLITLVVCGLAIALASLAIGHLHVYSALDPDNYQQTISPFVTLLVLALQAIETLLRLGFHAYRGILWLWRIADRMIQKNIEKERLKKDERRARRQEIWNGVIAGWNDILGRDRKPKQTPRSGDE